jgi:hypothetical protein
MSVATAIAHLWSAEQLLPSTGGDLRPARIAASFFVSLRHTRLATRFHLVLEGLQMGRQGGVTFCDLLLIDLIPQPVLIYAGSYTASAART